MTIEVADWVLVTSATTGTGTISLGPSVDPSYITFAKAFTTDTPVWYSLTLPNGDRECGKGVYRRGSDQLERTTIHATLVNGAKGPNTPIDLQGETVVGCTLNAEAMNQLLTALSQGAIRGVKVFGPQTQTPTGAVAGDFWLVP